VRPARIRRVAAPSALPSKGGTTVVQLKTSFCQSLREANADLWKAIREHPFIQDVENNRMTDDRLIYYFEQNIQYIELALKWSVIAASKAPDNDTLEVCLATARRGMPGYPDKAKDQRELLRKLGGDPDHLPEMGPANRAYTDHLLKIACLGETVDLLAAFTPCPWTYDDMAHEFFHKLRQPATVEWLEYWAGNEHQERLEFRKEVINRLVSELPEWRQDQVRRNFRISMKYEWRFWDDAYHKRPWPV